MVIVLLKLIAGLAVLLFIPGYLCTRVLRGRSRTLSSSTLLECIFISALVSVILASWIALVMAELAVFSLSAILIILLSTSVVLLIVARGTSWSLPRPMRRGVILVPIFILLALMLYSPPYEYILGNWDPGTYVNAGAHLAKNGSITIHDSVLREIPEQDRELFYHTHLLKQRYEGGMVVADSREGIVSPHFYHLYTCWIALFYTLGGVNFSLWVNVFFGILALAAIYLAVRELTDTRTALLTSIFVMASAAEIWNVRFPTAEITTQLLLFSGLFSLFRYQRDGGGFWAVLSGVCFAEAFLTRVTAVIVLPFLILIFFWRNWNRWRRGDMLFLIPIAAGLVHLIIQNATICHSYIERQMEVLRSQGFTRDLLFVSSACFIAIIVVARIFLKGWKLRLERFFDSPGFRIILGLLLLGLFVFSYYLLPSLSESADARNLRELGWFIYPLSVGRSYLPLGLYLALVGVLLFIRDGSGQRWGSFLIIVLPISTFFLYKKMVFPSYLWAIRRYIPLVFPSIIFFMAYALTSIGKRKRIGLISAWLVVLLLLASMQLRYVKHVRGTDFLGTIDFTNNLVEQLDRKGLYICEGSGLAAPLDYVYDLDLLQLSQQTPEKCRSIEKLISRRLKSGRRVYYISRGGWPISQSLNFVPLFQLPLRTDYLEHSVGRFPRRRNPVQINARVFRVEKMGETPEGNATSRPVDIGENCFGLISGFHGLARRWEIEDGERVQRWARWTRGDAEIVIPTFGSSSDLMITVRASAGKGRPVDSLPVEVSVDGKRVTVIKIGKSLEEQSFKVRASDLPSGKERAVLKLSSPVWNPASAGLKGYPSELGIYVDRLMIEMSGD